VILPDANLLLYAYDEAGPFHKKAKGWWEDLLRGPEEVGLCPCVLFAFIRIGTNARAFENPLHIDEATGIVDQWLEAGGVRILAFTPEDAECAMRLLNRAGAGGNLTTDAQIAATASRLKARVDTADTDFARFDIDWRNPLSTG
jgi:toxin-antitoxin system PIN domain toxin